MSRTETILELMSNNKPWTSRELADALDCAVSQVHDATRKLYEQGKLAKSSRKGMQTLYALSSAAHVLPKSDLPVIAPALEEAKPEISQIAHTGSVFTWGNAPTPTQPADDPYRRGVLDAVEAMRTSAEGHYKRGQYADAHRIRNLASNIKARLCRT